MIICLQKAKINVPDGQYYKDILSNLAEQTYDPYSAYVLGEKETLSDTGLLVEEFDEYFTIIPGPTKKERASYSLFVPKPWPWTFLSAAQVFIIGNEIEIKIVLTRRGLVFYSFALFVTSFMIIASILSEGDFSFLFVIFMLLFMLAHIRKDSRKFIEFAKGLFQP